MNLFLTCEHAGNEIPEKYHKQFEDACEVLNTHRGYDPGALDLFQKLSVLAVFSQPYMISRLLIEPNRSLNHPQLFSEFIKHLDMEGKQELLEDYYLPYRTFVEERMGTALQAGEKVLHISVHSFTPVLDGEVRNADIGLLFDPARETEEEFCDNFKNAIFEKNENLRTKFNYPYLGTDDGFTTYLREKFSQDYMGIELEVNQKFVEDNKMEKRFKNDIFEALRIILNDHP